MDEQPKNAEETLPETFSFDELKYKSVEVISAGVSYHGIFIGADEKDVYLKGQLRWIILPIERISTIREAGGHQSFNSRKQISSSFYDKADEDPT